MPAIVLMNHHHAVDLLKLLDGNNDDPMASFWRERSFLYVMGKIYAHKSHNSLNITLLTYVFILFLEENEYFYQPKPPQQLENQRIYTVDHLPLFQEAHRKWHDAQQKKQIHDIPPMDSPLTTSDNASELSEEYSFNG